MNPKHTNPRKDREAHAPYNYVPLPEAVVAVDESEVPDQDKYQGQTGSIECVLKTETPTYTRSAMNPEFFRGWGETSFDELPDDKKGKLANFFHVDDLMRPIIPGSSLRGMVRALVEIVSYSKVQYVTNQQLIYRAVGGSASLGEHYRNQMLRDADPNSRNIHLDYPTPKLKGGYLRKRKDGWAIQPAKEYYGESFVRVEYDDAIPLIGGPGRQTEHHVYVTPVPRKPSHRRNIGRRKLILNVAITPNVTVQLPSDSDRSVEMVPATLIESGHMGGRSAKHWHCAIYEADTEASRIPIPNDLWEIYEQDRDMTRGHDIRQLNQDGDALFYLLDDDGELVFFGPTLMFRLPYPHTPQDLVPSELWNVDQADITEAIFGTMVETQNRRARASRIFFTDAQFETARDEIYVSDTSIAPQILASPKPTSFPQHLVQDTSLDHDPDDKNQLAHYATLRDETTIRGHKLYWHKSDELKREDFEAEEKDVKDAPKQYTRIKPVNREVQFRFRVYFENLHKYELGALLWVLQLPGNPEKEYRHKIGMGKPLGLGSIEIIPSLHLSDRNERYTTLFDEDEWHAGERQEHDQQQFMQAFENYVLDNMNQQERNGAQSLAEVERIQMLLTMLEWPGPDPELTKYMQIEPENEYKDRPVLPDPSQVAKFESSRPERYTGRVKWFSDDKGYGFIKPDQLEDDVFVHFSAIQGEGYRTLNEGECVEFSVTESEKGPRAEDVTRSGKGS